jgi:hypothetical protein
MRSVRVERQSEECSELVLEWVHLPGDSLWEHVEERNRHRKAAFPALLVS